MRRIVRAAAPAVVLGALAGGLVLATPGRASLVVHLWLVAAMALAAGAVLRALLRLVPRGASEFDAAFAQIERARARPASLARMERVVGLASGTAFDVHYRLRPTMRPLAASLLAARGVDLERSPQAAEALVGPDAWDVIRPNRAPPENRGAPGLPLASIERAVDALENVQCS
ncbi:MAG TPA: hypothetical protein VFN99_03275 [Gaiella sp.]|nr:hypothetical protein [Gaiella sp.]